VVSTSPSDHSSAITTLLERLIHERSGRGNHELRGPAKPAYHTKPAAVAGD